MKRSLAICLAMVLLALLSTGGVMASTEHTLAGDTVSQPVAETVPDRLSSDIFQETPPSDTGEEFDRVRFHVTIETDSSARWTVKHVRTLENESDIEQFEEFAERFNSEEMQLYRDFQQQTYSLTERGTNETNRNMTATAFDRDAYVSTGLETDVGVVEMSFTWTNFTSASADGLTVGDVFSSGLYLDEDQRLEFEPAAGIQFVNVSPEPDSLSHETLEESETIRWDQERQFDEGEPHIVLTINQTAVSEPIDDENSDNETLGNPIGDDTLWFLLVGLLAVVLGGTAAVAYRINGGMGAFGSSASAVGSSATDEVQSPVTDAELLSDEDRVINLLEANDGRMKQVNIVDRTDWSKSKVSMLLSEMEEREIISKLRVGRENIISLKGHEPDATRSPLDDKQ